VLADRLPLTGAIGQSVAYRNTQTLHFTILAH
jgi:hypothetical protein